MDQLKDALSTPFSVIALLTVTTLIFIWISKRSRNCWKDLGIPYVKPLPFFGNLLETIGKSTHDIDVERYKKYGDIYGHYEGKSACLSVADPKLLRNILVKDFQYFTNRRTFQTGDEIAESMLQNLTGENWKRIRTIITPTFTTGKIKRMLDIFTSCSTVIVDNFKSLAERGETIDLKSNFTAFTMDIIASSAFSTKIDSHNDPNNEFVQKARAVFSGGFNYKFVLYLMFPSLVRFFKIPIFSQEAIHFFSEITRQIIEERKKTGKKRNDFLQLLLDTAEEQQTEKVGVFEAKEDILSNYESETNDQVFKSLPPSKKVLSFTELVAQCVIFFLAGSETTASTLTLATYQLAVNPEIQEKLRKEVDETIKANNGKLTYEAVQGMKYLDNVISETLRITPPASRIERVASEEYELGSTGIRVPKNVAITIPVHAIHHEEKYYPNSNKFDPNRFTPEEKAKRDPYTYLPFGAGPRNCVAMRFALVETKVCLAYIISHLKVLRCPQTKVPEFKKSQGLLSVRDIFVTMEERKDCPLV